MGIYKGLRKPRRKKNDTDESYAQRVLVYQTSRASGTRETRARKVVVVSEENPTQ